MSKRKLTTKKTWRICDEVLDPVAAKLEDIVRKWNYSSEEPPRSVDIDWLYDDHNVKFAITWLKLNISVDFAVDFEKTLYDPLSQFKKLDFRACQILEGDMAETSKEVIHRHQAIRTVIDNRYAWLQENHPDPYEFDRYDDEILGEIENKYGEVEHGFRDAADYLRQVSAILRAKIAKQRLLRKDVVSTRNDFIDSGGVANLLGIEKRTIESYRKDWPEPDIAHKGRAPAKWRYHRLLPKLKEQFPKNELPESLD